MLTAAAVEGRTLFPLLDILSADVIPSDIPQFSSPAADLLNRIYFAEALLQPQGSGYVARLVIVLNEEIAIAPFGEALQLVVGSAGGLAVFEVEARVQGRPGGVDYSVELIDVPLLLRVPSSVLRPLKPNSDEPDLEARYFDISLGAVSLSFSSEGGLDFQFTGSPSIPRCMIADSGIILSIGSIQWLTPASENPPANTPPELTGLYLDDVTLTIAGLDLDTNPEFRLDYGFFGRGGFTGRIELSNLNLAGSLGGFEFALNHFALGMTQNAISSSDIRGRVMLPFFDAPIDVALSFNTGGEFLVSLAGPGGLVTLTRPDILTLTVDSVRFGRESGVFFVALSGEITPLVGDFEWPTIRIQELSIDSGGNVHIEGGWLELREQYVLSFYGFQLEISKIGFGTTVDNRR